MVVPAPTDRNPDGFRLSPVPAARIEENTVESRRGPALWIRGMGPMAVRNNRFVAMDVLADLADNLTDAADAYVGGVYLVHHGLPGYFAGWLSALGFKGLQEGFAAQGQPMERLGVGGPVQRTGNQTRLDRPSPATALALDNTLIFSLDDTSVADHQREGVPDIELLSADLINSGLTTPGSR